MKSPVIVKISWSWKLFNFIIQFVFLFIVNIFVSVLGFDQMNFYFETFLTGKDLIWPKNDLKSVTMMNWQY